MRKRPSDADVIGLLRQPHFRRSEEDDPSNDPIAPTPMIVEVDRIKPYDHNPRRAPNSEYERIKESIRRSGMDQTLSITRRPDDETYMVCAGGNTRLQAVAELWRETGGEAFRRIHCLYRPWTGDPDVLIAHLKENDLRGDLAFIDRALAVRHARELIEQEIGEGLSQRRLIERLQEMGYGISKTLLVWLEYAVDVLYPAIPIALNEGMGRPRIERIHGLDRGFSAAWEALALGDKVSAQPVFTEVLARFDGETLDLDALRRDLDTELSVSADCDLQRASLVLGAALDGRPIPRFADEQSPDTAWGGSRAEDTPANTEPESPTGAGNFVTAPTLSDPSAEAPPRASERDNVPNFAGTEPNNAQPRSPTTATTPATPPSDLESLRERSRTLATRLAHKARMGDVVVSISTGMGYLVASVPYAVADTAPPEVVRSMATVWWQLTSVAEQFAPHGRALAHRPAAWTDTPIDEAMRAGSECRGSFVQWQWQRCGPELFNAVPPLNGPDLGPLTYLIWSERDWADWVALVETYRAIHRLTDGDPWEAR